MYDIKQEFIEAGLVGSATSARRRRGKINPDDEKQILDSLRSTTKLETFEESTLIIEAVPEKLELKRDISSNSDGICGPEPCWPQHVFLFRYGHRGDTQHPERVLGLHFFNPPPLMALVEVIQGDRTALEVIDKATELMCRMGKTPARAKDTPGFIVNRVARPFYNEALRILGDGDATVESIDRIMRLAGNFRMGPFELMDLIGHDVNFAATESLYRSFLKIRGFAQARFSIKWSWEGISEGKRVGVFTSMTRNSLAIIGEGRLSQELLELSRGTGLDAVLLSDLAELTPTTPLVIETSSTLVEKKNRFFKGSIWLCLVRP